MHEREREGGMEKEKEESMEKRERRRAENRANLYIKWKGNDR